MCCWAYILFEIFASAVAVWVNINSESFVAFLYELRHLNVPIIFNKSKLYFTKYSL